MKKRTILSLTLVLVLLLALFAFCACDDATSEVGVELLSNGTFSKFNDSKFDGWTTSSSSVVFTKKTYESDSSDSFLSLSNSSDGYSYLKQTISVDTKKYYKISVDIRVVSDLNGDGAYVALLENTDYKFVKQTSKTDGFKTCTFYVQPKNTDYLTVALCLGSEDNQATGKVYFDNISVTRIEKEDIPSSSQIYEFKKAKTVISDSNSNGIAFVTVLSIFTVLMFAGLYYALRRLYSKQDAFQSFDYQLTYSKNAKISKSFYKKPWFVAIVLALVTFLLRFILLLTTYGEGAVMTDILIKARGIFTTGITNSDYSAILDSNINLGSIYILATLGAIGQNAELATLSILFRFINILADIAVVLMIYFYGRKYVGDKVASLYCALYAILPISFVISGMQASFTSLTIALVLASLYLMSEKKYISTYFVMTLASVLDIRAMAIAPIIVAYFIYRYIVDVKDIKKFTSNRAKIVFGLIASFVLAYLITLPFAINQISAGDAFYNFKLIVSEVKDLNFFTYNAFNLYGMVAMNAKTLADGVSILNLIFILVLEAYVISLYFKNKNKQELILLVSFTFAMIAVFTLKISYTYLLLAIVFALIYTMISGDKRMFIVLASYSVLGLLAIAQLYNQSGLFVLDNSEVGLLNYETTSPFFIVFCVFTVLVSIYYVYVAYSITNDTKIVDIKPMNESIINKIKAKLKKD